MHNSIVLALSVIFGLIVLSTGIRMRLRRTDFWGKPSIHRAPYLIGKVSMSLSWGFLIAQAAGVNVVPWVVPVWLSWLGTAAVAVAMVFVGFSFHELGMSSRFGIPREKIILKTKGIYRISRNPMYIGFYLICAGSCIRAPSLLNLLFSLIGISIHHRVVIAEERFLEGEFKEDWLKYKSKTRRYL